MQPEDKGWIVKTKKRKRPLTTKPAREFVRPIPIKHFWIGFDKLGNENWFIELDNGKVISSTDESYQYWLKRYNSIST